MTAQMRETSAIIVKHLRPTYLTMMIIIIMEISLPQHRHYVLKGVTPSSAFHDRQPNVRHFFPPISMS